MDGRLPGPLVAKFHWALTHDAVCDLLADDGKELEPVAAPSSSDEETVPRGMVCDDEVARRRIRVPAEAGVGEGSIDKRGQRNHIAQCLSEILEPFWGDTQLGIVEVCVR